jgi:hypothetical protein
VDESVAMAGAAVIREQHAAAPGACWLYV